MHNSTFSKPCHKQQDRPFNDSDRSRVARHCDGRSRSRPRFSSKSRHREIIKQDDENYNNTNQVNTNQVNTKMHHNNDHNKNHRNAVHLNTARICGKKRKFRDMDMSDDNESIVDVHDINKNNTECPEQPLFPNLPLPPGQFCPSSDINMRAPSTSYQVESQYMPSPTPFMPSSSSCSQNSNVNPSPILLDADMDEMRLDWDTFTSSSSMQFNGNQNAYYDVDSAHNIDRDKMQNMNHRNNIHNNITNIDESDQDEDIDLEYNAAQRSAAPEPNYMPYTHTNSNYNGRNGLMSQRPPASYY